MEISHQTIPVLLHLLGWVIFDDCKCAVREPPGVGSPPQHGDAGFQLRINEQPEFYEERNLYTVTLKVWSIKF